MHDDEDIDRAIDEVARQLTADAPSAPLRRQVLNRLSSDRHAARWMIPATAVAVLLALVLVSRFPMSNRQPGGRDGVAVATMRDVSLTHRASEPRAAEQTARSGTRAPESAGAPGIVGRVVRLPIEDSPVDALAPAALEVAPIHIDSMATATSIAVQPLDDITPLAIVPLDESEGDRR